MIDPKSLLTDKIIDDAKQHAREAYPCESCGIVFDGEYLRFTNVAEDPEKDFAFNAKLYAQFVARGEVTAIIHSHPGGPLFPTQSDMESQIRTAVPWGIIPLLEEDGEMRVGAPIMWGDQLAREPLIGRSFVHGITDCYSLVRDAFAAGKEEMARQQVSNKWPFDPIQLPEVPRDDSWWDGEQDLYRDGLKHHGFRVIQQHEARPGDGFLIKVRSSKLNHAGLLVTDDVIIHHLPGRLSRREPAGMWGRQADLWVRYEGPGSNA